MVDFTFEMDEVEGNKSKSKFAFDFDGFLDKELASINFKIPSKDALSLKNDRDSPSFKITSRE